MTSVPQTPDLALATDFRIGKVIATSLGIFRQHIGAFSLIAGIVWLPASLIYAIDEQTAPALSQVSLVLGVTALMLFLWPLVSAIILQATIQHMRRGTVSISEAVRSVFSRTVPLFGLMVLSTLGLLLGFMILIVPGIILMVLWFVAVPACIAERTGPVQSLKRSRQLTDGYRWRIFALLLLTIVANAIGEGIVAAAQGAQASLFVRTAVDVVWQGFSGGFSSVLVAVAYYYLRVTKEGADIEQIAAVFD